jgi:hypothetical protein
MRDLSQEPELTILDEIRRAEELRGKLARIEKRGQGNPVQIAAALMALDARIAEMKKQLAELDQGSRSAALPADTSAAVHDGIVFELERLTALHESGALDDEEFRAAKARIIHGG